MQDVAFIPFEIRYTQRPSPLQVYLDEPLSDTGSTKVIHSMTFLDVVCQASLVALDECPVGHEFHRGELLDNPEMSDGTLD